ncbi:MAG: hypothetical protein ACFE0P_08500 [Oceanicaulis sp.]
MEATGLTSWVVQAIAFLVLTITLTEVLLIYFSEANLQAGKNLLAGLEEESRSGASAPDEEPAAWIASARAAAVKSILRWARVSTLTEVIIPVAIGIVGILYAIPDGLYLIDRILSAEVTLKLGDSQPDQITP